jgi:hypothetical protein
MVWWRFNMDKDATSEARRVEWLQSQTWSDVAPGDMVQSKGTLAWRPEEVLLRTSAHTRVFHLKGAPILVLSRTKGVPGEADSDHLLTFLCLSRHGLIVVLGQAGENSQEGTRQL